MPIYRKTSSSTYERYFESDLQNGAAQSFLGLEIKADGTHPTYYFYRVEIDNGNKRLVRFPLRKYLEKYILMRDYFVYELDNASFSKQSQSLTGAPPSIPEYNLFTDVEIKYLLNLLELENNCSLDEVDCIDSEHDDEVDGDFKDSVAPVKPFQNEDEDLSQIKCFAREGDVQLDNLNEQLYMFILSIALPQYGSEQSISNVLTFPEYRSNDFRMHLLKFINECMESDYEHRNFNLLAYRGAYRKIMSEFLEMPDFAYIELFESLQKCLIGNLPHELIHRHYSLKISGFVMAQKVKLSEQLDDAIQSNRTPWILLEALKDLHLAKIFTSKNVEMNSLHSNSHQFARALINLNEKSFLTPETRQVVFLDSEPQRLAKLLLAHKEPKRLIKALQILKKFNLLDVAHCISVCQHSESEIKAFNIVCDDKKLVNPFVSKSVVDLLDISVSLADQPKDSAPVTKLKKIDKSSPTISVPVDDNAFIYHPNCNQLKIALDRLVKSTKSTFANEPELIERVSKFCREVDAELKQYSKNPRRYPSYTKKSLEISAINKAKACFGLDHKIVRIFADILMTLSCAVGVGLIAIGIKKAYTGRCFFYFGKNDEQKVVKRFENDLSAPTLL